MTRDLIPWRKKHDILPARKTDSPITELHQRMDELFDDFFGGFGVTRWPLENSALEKMIIAPDIDISETDDEITVSADLPGLDEKDLQVTLDNGILTIRGEKEREKEEKKRDYHLIERSYGEFQRSIPLPSEIDPDKIHARFKKGVLRVSIPKKAETRKSAKKIGISTD